jgi:hypothetical protein
LFDIAQKKLFHRLIHIESINVNDNQNSGA